MPELTMPETKGPQGGFAARELQEDGRFGEYIGGGNWRQIRENWQDAPLHIDEALAQDLYAYCFDGQARRAWQIMSDALAKPYFRGGVTASLNEALAWGDLGTAFDGSVRTHILDGWGEVQWEWTDVLDIASYPDYETHKLQILGEVNVDSREAGTTASGTMPEIAAGQGYPESTISEKYETISIKDYGFVMSVQERALRADDKNVLVKLPRTMGRAAKRTVNANVANLFDQTSGTGPLMTEDSARLFSSTHSNVVDTALAIAAVETGIAAMAGQRSYIGGGATGRVLNMAPVWLVVPIANDITAAKIIGPNATQLVAALTTPVTNFNAIAGRLRQSTWSCLTDSSSWMLLTDKNVHPTAQVAFLDGRQEPIIEVQGGMGPDLSDAIGRKYRVRLPHGVGVVDWRGMYRSNT
jgi:hypothetical protein